MDQVFFPDIPLYQGTNDPAAAGVSMGAADTTALWHAGKLSVLEEDDLPCVLDPVTPGDGRKARRGPLCPNG